MARRSHVPPLTAVALCLLMAASMADVMKAAMNTAVLIVVDQSGRGNFTKLQDAINAVPVNNIEAVFILVKPGIYREKLIIPATKPYITISGTRAADQTVITWNDSTNTYGSATLAVLASDFVGRYLTIQNSFGTGAQAVAARVSGERVAFVGCRFLGYQDTLLDDIGSHYYRSCYIEGAVDFICGNGASLFENCHLHSISNAVGTITAQRRESPSENTGFSFLGGKITGINGALLGRPWGAFSRVVFAFTYMSGVILPQGWDDWHDPSKQSTVYYGQYRCYGRGAGVDRRVPWSINLTSQEAAPFLTKAFIGGAQWLRPPPTNFRRAFSAKP